jgi:hypothetical protein
MLIRPKHDARPNWSGRWHRQGGRAARAPAGDERPTWLKRYADAAETESAACADELASDGDLDGAAV